MRLLNIVLGLLMLVFAGVQLNDPDSLIWMVYYLVGAAWALMAAFQLYRVRTPGALRLLWLCIAAAVAGVVYYFPQMDRFWERDVWWAEETAREGMGVMILLIVLLVVLFTARPVRKPAESR